MSNDFRIVNGRIYEGESMYSRHISATFLYYADGREIQVETVETPRYLKHDDRVFLLINPSKKTYSEILPTDISDIAVEAIKQRIQASEAENMAKYKRQLRATPEDIEQFERDLANYPTISGECLSSGQFRKEVTQTPEALKDIREFWRDYNEQKLINPSSPKPIGGSDSIVDFNPTPEDLQKMRDIFKTED